jgi:hypothetical protein
VIGGHVKRLALWLIWATLFAQPVSAKDIVCSWQDAADHYRSFTCHIAGERGVPNTRVLNLRPTPRIVRLVAQTVPGSNIDPELVLAIIAAESAFDRRAVSPKNAMGLMQLMPETVARFGVRDPFNAEENVRAGTSYLQLLLGKYRDLRLALAAYNAGEGPVLSYGGVPPYEETTEYIARVLRLYERYKGLHDRSESFKVAPAPATKRIKGSGTCGLECRGNMLAARLDDVSPRVSVSP